MMSWDGKRAFSPEPLAAINVPGSFSPAPLLYKNRVGLRVVGLRAFHIPPSAKFAVPWLEIFAIRHATLSKPSGLSTLQSVARKKQHPHPAAARSCLDGMSELSLRP